MGIYLDNGFADMEYIIRRGMPFSFVIGGRGTGKTYGALLYCLKTGIKFCLMRRTQSQLDTIARPDTNPFKSVVADLALDWSCEPVPAGKNIYAYRKTTYDSEGKPVYEDLLGYAIALSTTSNLRGFDMTDVELVIYDEFIPESHERPIRNESAAFFNVYETINRNRELPPRNQKPLQVLCLANANEFANPLLIGVGLVSTVETMIAKGKTEYVNPQRGVGVWLLTDSPISTQKATTALYKLTIGTSYSDMAIKNAFAGTNDSDVYSVDLREYNPLVALGEVVIYKHKSTSLYYVSAHESGNVSRYSGDGADMKRFFATHRNLLLAAMCGKVIYESHLIKALFLKYCGF